VLLHRTQTCVVAGQRQIERVPDQAGVGGDRSQQLAHEAGLAGDGVGSRERVPSAVAVAVEAFADPGRRHELRQTLSADRADGTQLPAALGSSCAASSGAVMPGQVPAARNTNGS
jgi:hypothetical protein